MGKNVNKQYDLLVIGAGASGMMAAITAAREHKKVCIIEKADKAGKKLFATGNGKCNFTNEYMNTECFYGDRAFVEYVLQQFTVEDCLNFFHSIGIYPKNKNGYYYPNSEQASSVVKALVQELERLHVKLSFEIHVKDILSENGNIQVITDKGIYSGKKLVIATGLLASPKLGSDGSIFDVVKTMGHRFSPILPTLCGFYCKGIPFKKVAGVRAHGTVAAIINGKKQAEDTGEIQFTEYGLSGIPVFQISHVLSKGLYEKQNVEIQVNLLPNFDKNQLMNELKYRKSLFAQHPLENLLNGLIQQKLIDFILDKLHLDREIFVSSITEKDIEKIADTLQKITVSVSKYRDFEFAQVCMGGIPVSDVSKESLESKYVRNIHFTGEILDVDGICGGYNLHFAWATGYIAGKSC